MNQFTFTSLTPFLTGVGSRDEERLVREWHQLGVICVSQFLDFDLLLCQIVHREHLVLFHDES